MILRSARLYQVVLKRLKGTKSRASVEPKFSESAAFQGRGIRPGAPSRFVANYYESDEFGYKKIISALASLSVLIAYFGWLREPSDLDDVWSTPPHILTSNLERKMLINQIDDAKKSGKSTELLQAQLDYVDIKQEALRIQFEQKKK